MVTPKEIQKVLIIGSGPFVAGQSSEYDYLGSETVTTFLKHHWEVVVLNPNSATLMTDNQPHVSVYMEPLTPQFLVNVWRKELPDAIYPWCGGVEALNLLESLLKSSFSEHYSVNILGKLIRDSDQIVENDNFRDFCSHLNLQLPPAITVADDTNLAVAAQAIGFPVILRAQGVSGGTGTFNVQQHRDLETAAWRAQRLSPVHRCIMTKSYTGQKEVSFISLRDQQGHMSVIFNAEQLNPLGIHGGDSITIAPVQTLTAKEFQTLREIVLKLTDYLNIVGCLSVRFAIDRQNGEPTLVKFLPGLNRMTTFAAKTLSLPLAQVIAELSMGKELTAIPHPYEANRSLLVEPDFDFVSLRLPRWPFDRLNRADRTLGPEMKSTGSVIVFERNLEAALLKGVRSLEPNQYHIVNSEIAHLSDETLTEKIIHPEDNFLFYWAEAIRRGFELADLSKMAKVDQFYMAKIAHIVQLEQELLAHKGDMELLAISKYYGFSDYEIARQWQLTSEQIRQLRTELGIQPGFQELNALASTPLIHSHQFFITFATQNEAHKQNSDTVFIIGSGPTRVGQGAESDYLTYHALQELHNLGYHTVLLNNNPDGNSTNLKVADRLYYGPITMESIMNIVSIEQPVAVLTQFGGKLAAKLTRACESNGLPVVGLSVDSLTQVYKVNVFEQLLTQLNIPSPKVTTLTSSQGVASFIEKSDLTYPILVHPNPAYRFVPTEVVTNQAEMKQYFTYYQKNQHNFPFTAREYMSGNKYEVDALFDGDQTLILGILEHLEHTSIHSGEALSVTPAQHLTKTQLHELHDLLAKVGQALCVRGLIHVRFLVKKNILYVLAVDLKASRNLAFFNKLVKVDLVALAVRVIMGTKLADLGLKDTLMLPLTKTITIKIPVASYTEINPDQAGAFQTKITGEALGSDQTYEKALYKAFEAANQRLPVYGRILFSVSSRDYEQSLRAAQRFAELGYKIMATKKTANYFQKHGLTTMLFETTNPPTKALATAMTEQKVQMLIYSTEWNGPQDVVGAILKENAILYHLPLLSTMEEASAILKVLESRAFMLEPF